MDKYDVIIPVAEKDISFLPITIRHIKKNLVGANKIFVITNQKFIKKLQKLLGNDVILIDENTMYLNLNFGLVDRILRKQNVCHRTGWYFQQFLKMAFALTEYSDKYYLSWDADTIPLCKIEFFQEGKPLFTQKKEYHEPYFKTLEKLLGLKKAVDFSFIAEHMLFDKEIMQKLISDIEKSCVQGVDWIEKILNACDSLSKPCFSEFETYGTYCMNYYNDKYGFRTLKTFRYAGLIRGRHVNDDLINKLAFDLDTASFEIFDCPPFPYNDQYLLWVYKRRWNQVFKRTPLQLLSYIMNKIKGKV